MTMIKSVAGKNVTLNDSAGAEIGVAGNPLKVDVSGGTIVVTPSGVQQVTGTGAAGTPAAGVVSVQGVPLGTPAQTLPLGPVCTDSYPNPISAYPDPNATGFKNDYNFTFDGFNNLQTRGPIITDELSIFNDFTGSTLQLNLTGTVKFANNSTQVTGVATLFTKEVKSGSYIRRQAGTDSEYVQVDYVQDDTTLYLVSNYSGNFNNVPAQISEFIPVVTGGASYSVSNSLLNLISGTANGNQVSIANLGDYLPFNKQFLASISQRISNQSTIIGFRDQILSTQQQAVVVFDGTNATQVKFRTSTSSAAADIQETLVTLPKGATTSALNLYQIDLIFGRAALLINNEVVAVHEIHVPYPYQRLSITASISNVALVTSTTVQIDFIRSSNQNRINVGNDFNSDPLAVNNYGLTANGSLKQMSVGASGEAYSVDFNSTKATFMASQASFVAANAATDIFTLTGSATKTIRVTRIAISGIQTTAGSALFVLLKRSTANAAGTSTTLTAVPLDSTSAAATAIARSYTANPTLGTLIGNLASQRLFVPTATGSANDLVWTFGENASPIILRGTNEVLAINLNGATLAGNNLNAYVEWTEE